MSAMNESFRRGNSIIVKNLPTQYTQTQLETLFSKFGRIISTKILPANPNFEGACGFVNFADGENCSQAVKQMDNTDVDGFILNVSQAAPRFGGLDRQQNGFRTSLTDENNVPSSPRINGFRPVTDQSLKSLSINSPPSITNPFESSSSNGYKIQSPVSPTLAIAEHEPFIKNQTYNVYLSNLEVPNVVFVATLDDYVNATLLITQMNKHEQLMKVQANSYKTKLAVGEMCAAQFNGDWYRARILEIGENRVRVQYIDWGNTNWCDTILEIRPLPAEYFKDPVLCVKCILDGVPSINKLSETQSNGILGILVLDLKLEMFVVRIENGIPYIRLNIAERNLNQEICQLLPPSVLSKSNLIVDYNSSKVHVNLTETHFVQLTTVDPESDCFHVLLLRDHIAKIVNTLKDWNANKQPITNPLKIGMLVCAQYDADDLWYRAWIKNIRNNSYHVYFVDFGNEETVSLNRLSECPESIRTIPWQSVQIRLANIQLTDDERYELLKDFETERLEMKISQKNQEIYLVDLITNGKSIVENVLEMRKKQPPPLPQVPITTMKSPISLPTQPIVSNIRDTNSKDKSDNTINDNLTILISEQRRQNRLLEQVLAAINTTNALLTQLVQR